jgi:hypothetical protein
MIPHNTVNPTQGGTSFHVSLNASMDPTPPPEVVAMTKFTFQEKGAGDDALDKMWVTSTRREGPALICEGWLVRYPHATGPAPNGPNLVSVPIGGSHGVPAVGPPIVEEHATTSCTERALVPFTPPSPSSP